MAQNLDLKCVFAIRSHLWCRVPTAPTVPTKTRLEFSIKKFKPHFVLSFRFTQDYPDTPPTVTVLSIISHYLINNCRLVPPQFLTGCPLNRRSCVSHCIVCPIEQTSVYVAVQCMSHRTDVRVCRTAVYVPSNRRPCMSHCSVCPILTRAFIHTMYV